MKRSKWLVHCLALIGLIFVQSPAVSAAPPAPSGSWQTYVSSAFGYSIQYPVIWRVQERKQPNRDNIVSDMWFGDQVHVTTQVPAMPNPAALTNATRIALSSHVPAWRIERPDGVQYVLRANGADFTLAFIARGSIATNQQARGMFETMAYTFIISPTGAQQALPSTSRSVTRPSAIPNAPTNLRVLTASMTTSSIPLAWDDNSNDELGFHIYKQNTSTWNWDLLQTVGAQVTTFTDTGLACANQYSYQVTAYNADGESSGVYLYSWLLDCGINPPSNLRVLTPVTTSSIPLAWDDNSNNESGFRIDKWDVGNFVWDPNASIYLGPNVTSYTLTGLQCGDVYNYRVVAFNAQGTSINNPELWMLYQGSNIFGYYPLDCLPPPSNLQVLTPAVSMSSIPLTWNDNSNDELGFRIYRSDGSYFGPSGAFLGAVGAGVTTFTDIGLKCGTGYTYHVKSYNANGESANNPSVWYQTLPCPASTDPAPPSNLRVLTPMSSSSIPLAWDDNSNNETGFKIYRDGNLIQTVGAGVRTFTDGVPCGSPYFYYRVSAYNANGESSPNPSIWATTGNCSGPIAPSYLHALTPTLTSTSIPLAWNDNSNDELGFKIYRDFTYKQSVGPNVTNFTDTGLQCSTFYWYNIAAFNANGDSYPTWLRQQTLPCGPTPPSNVRQITASTTSSSIPILWDDNSSDETGFKIHTWDNLGEHATTVGPNITTYTVLGLGCNNYHDIGVSAFNASGESPTWSFWLRTKACTGPNPPANVRIGNILNAPLNVFSPNISRQAISIPILWNDASSDETGFKIYRSSGGAYSLLATLVANVTSYNDTTATLGTTYSYKVSSYNANGESVYLLAVPVVASSNGQHLFLPFIRR